MKIKIVLTALVSIIFLSCSSDNEDVAKVPTTDFELKLDEYGLFDIDKNFEGYTLGLDTNLIYFNGRLDNQLCMEAFNKDNKINLLSWESDDKLVLEVHEGYGVNSTHEISVFRTINPYDYNDKHTYILWGIAEGDQYDQRERIITSDLYFTSVNKKYESMTFPSKAYFYSDLIPWYEDKVLVTKTPVEWNYGKLDSCFCYSMTGEEVFKFEKNINFYPDRNYIVISTSNYIEFVGDAGGYFCNKDITENIQVWESDKPLSDLPEDTRIDSIEFSLYGSSQISCIFNYTFYSGEKGTREVKVEIETGKIIN
ncbi:MAG: hypothetical protein N4A59_03785 [Marinifilum sp.]|jgi:hypothetical protein|nr:hypothetical protein [Marinifilum sp.]